MKTLLVTAFLALASVGLGACSSDSPSTLTTSTAGTVAQNGACSTSDDCEPNGGLLCAYPVNDAGTACPTKGVCVALGPFSVEQVCPCGGKVFESAYVTSTYSTVPPGGTGCSAATTGDSGTTTTPTDSGTTTTPTDSGTKATDAGGGSKTGG